MADADRPTATGPASGHAPLALVLGASGYVGGRLVPRLRDAGWEVRCLARSPQKLQALPWGDDVEVRAGDLLAGGAEVEAAFEGVDVVYHLVHSMGATAAFADADRRIAARVAAAAHAGRARRLVYLGALGAADGRTSEHLRSRAEVADVLRAGPVPCTVLRAAVIIGSGSASFEMLRHLVEKLPVMVCPRWVRTRVQPVAIRDVLRYLVAVAADLDDRADHDYDVGGADVLTYLDMMQVYARVAGLPRRVVIPAPVLSPALSSHWVNLVTPVPFAVAKPLVGSLVTEVVARDPARGGTEDIREVDDAPAIGYEQALRLALHRLRDAEVETSWRDAEIAGRSPAEPYPGDPAWSGGTLLRDVRTAEAHAPAPYVLAAVCRIGGDAGWPGHMWAWRLRGRADRLIGGVGLRRGRRDPVRLRVGDAVDFWRVERITVPGARTGAGEAVQAVPGLLRLRAEMRLPGRAWLEFRIEPDAPAGRVGTTLVQRALFAPRGLLGRVYWWLLLPFHGPIFSRMVRALARDAERLAAVDVDGSILERSLALPTSPRSLVPPSVEDVDDVARAAPGLRRGPAAGDAPDRPPADP